MPLTVGDAGDGSLTDRSRPTCERHSAQHLGRQDPTEPIRFNAVPPPEVTVATAMDRARLVSSLVAAFARDPVLRYLFPDEDAYPRYAAAFFGYLFDRRVRWETIWTIEHGASAAIWESPAAAHQPSDELPAELPTDALDRMREYDRAVHTAMPAFPYWYLGVLGTHPDSAGRRWGHAVMDAGLRRAAADGLPAVLETSNPGNVEVYRRAGWQVVRTVTEPLPVWIMQQSPT
jgi:ribosomal protein S18 acetylase RimI-like enzyme